MAWLLFRPSCTRRKIKGEKNIISYHQYKYHHLIRSFTALISLAACSVEVQKMNFKIISVFLYLSVVLSIVVQNNAFVPQDDTGFRRRAADISGCKKVRIFFYCIYFLLFFKYTCNCQTRPNL